MTTAETDTVWPPDVLTLSIDIGGSGFKASIVNAQGVMTTERVRVDTPYPCPPERLVDTLTELVQPLLERAPRLSRLSRPRAARPRHRGAQPLARGVRRERDRELAEAWHGFDLAHASPRPSSFRRRSSTTRTCRDARSSAVRDWSSW